MEQRIDNIDKLGHPIVSLSSLTQPFLYKIDNSTLYNKIVETYGCALIKFIFTKKL